MGPVGVVLIMTGHERDAALAIGVSAVLNLILNAILIPGWGMEGAAVATAASTVVWNILMAIALYQRSGIHSTILGKLGLRWSS
jgi:O-antigen/teichoic acid export membrane protein